MQPDYPSDESSDSQTIDDKDFNGNMATNNKEIEKIAPKISPSVLSNLKKHNLLQEKFLEVLTVCSESHGYKSVTEICADVPQVFNKPVTPNNSQPQKCLSIVPPNVFRLGDEIPRYSVDDIEVGECIFVGMGEIYDISKFWIFFENGQLESLMEDLQKYFCNPDNRFPVPEALLQENLFCVCLYAQEYHRAMIVRLSHTSPGLVRVLFVDYGTVENVCTSNIWLLPKRFGEISCQLVRARLANICPPYENFPWSYKSKKRFEELAKNATVLNAEVVKVLKEDLCLEVFLADFSDENDISYFNDTLVEEGYAVYEDQKRKTYLLDPKPKVANIHLYPEFHEIEAGKAPTPTEMDNLMMYSVPMHHYLPKYFDITFNEDCDKIERYYEELATSKTDFNIDVTEIDNHFDFSVLSAINDGIFEFEEQNRTASDTLDTCGKTNDSTTQSSSTKYSCDQEVIAEDKVPEFTGQHTPNPKQLIPSNTPNIRSSCDREVIPLSDSLSASDQSVSDSSSKNKSTNPFLNENFASDSTNPFLDNCVKEAILDLFSKPSENSQNKNLNNLTTPCLGASQPCKDKPCRCVHKQEHVDKSISTNPFLSNDQRETDTSKSSNPFLQTRKSSNPFLNPNTQAVEPPRPPRVRTPPGFSSENLHPVAPSYLEYLNQMMYYQLYCAHANHFASHANHFAYNPYYQRWMMPQANFAMPPAYPGPYFQPQFQFNVQYVQRAPTPQLRASTPQCSAEPQKK